MGQFVGFSDEHSSLLANVHHLSTNFISPQFHVVFDDLFKTAIRTGVDKSVVKSICQDLFNLIGNFMQKWSLTKLAILFTSPLPSVRSGLMKLDNNKVMRIAYNSSVGTTTSCMIAIKQSNRLFLLLSQQTKMLMTILVCY
jgi:hypothetical protein